MYCKSGSSDEDEADHYGKRKLSSDDPDSPPGRSGKRRSIQPGNFHQQNTVEDTLQLSGSSSEDDEKELSRRPSLTSRVQTLVKEAEQPTFENSKIQRMLDKMGHKKGEGLGKHSQGRVAPVELSKQRGRLGLGFSLKGLEAATLEWDFSQEVISVEEEVLWLEEKDHCTLRSSDLESWMKEGPKKLEIDDETEFCDAEILQGVLNNKTIFDQLPPHELRKARMRCNPYETIRGGIFLNRAAMKMANMDAIFQFMFTNPKDPNGRSMVGNKLLYFADVCAGPGGFSEYVLWRKGWEAKGFGFTLKNENDFCLSDFLVGTPESFETHYGVDGLEGNGDVTVSDNIKEFTKYVMDRTEGQGVHFMMADGGFSVEGQENIQEILSKQLYLCQFLVALNIVRTDGHFVCKVFDLFTPFSAGLIYLLYKSFQKVSIHKPNTSRPANSERYVICKWKRDDCDDIREYMFSINERLRQLKKTDQDILGVVPLDVMKEDADFMEYLVESNNSLGDRQVVNLVKIAAFCRDTNLVELRQAELRTSCLSLWKVPDIPRKINNLKPSEKCDKLLGGNTAWMTAAEKVLDEKVLKESIKSSHDWRCYVVANRPEDPKLTFYLGLGQGKVYSMNPKSKGKPRWDLVNELKVELSPGTLILGETLQEHQGEGRSQKRVRALHIIDAFFLGNVDLRKTHLKERHALCAKFAEAMNRPLRSDLAPIRVKTIYRSLELRRIFRRLDTKTMKSSSGIERLSYTLEEDNTKYIIPSGILFIRETKDPWLKTLMGRNLCWYNLIDHQVKDNIPMDSIADLKCCFESRLMWRWRDGLSKFECNEHGDVSSLLCDTLPNNILLDHIDHCSGHYRPQSRQRPFASSSSSFDSSYSAKLTNY
ncbi:cap-specific mRNA (nucleoside-2'-O-)-methyltransferase 1 [Ischnura elegans]|uniref:cap-specific mRNA (nucleoside-2'-O-)-methyltransferase 1 n=1 Tax=Ischnura elegans TaxID=197161 RepID=UPI001ED87E8B|nr:cap-specific mRNA (nucleoside-2'-O-)-methyltransferase 1 [Ischnura elegans]